MKEYRIEECRTKLLELIRKKALRRGRFVLSSGRISNYYLDGRLITLTSEGAYLVARIILDLIKSKKITAIGGPSLGADPIVGAVITLALRKKRRLSGFIVRKSKKEHGRQRLIEGPPLRKGSRVILVDDVATTGNSLVQAKEILEQEGIFVDSAIVLVDRQEGARENLARVGCRLTPIFKKRDIL